MVIEIKELIGSAGDSDASTDSEQEGNLQFQENFNHVESAERKAQLKEIIKEINTKVKENQPVDLAQYPPLFVAHYRGVHYFKQFISQDERRKIRKKIKKDDFKAGIYSPAVYELAGLKIGAQIDSPEKKQNVEKAIKLLNEKFEELENEDAKEAAWWGKKTQHEKEIHQHYQRYVNNYQQFRDESKAKEYSCYQKLPSTKNPYISTADGAKHAALYALGGKAEIEQGCLRPGYQPVDDKKDKKTKTQVKPKPKHPKVGYVQIIFHKLDSLYRNKPLFLSVLHASKIIDIRTRLLNERETTFKTAIGKKHIVHTQTVRFPALNILYNVNYHGARYGIDTNQSYSRYQRMFFKKNSSGSTTLLDKIAEHYAVQLTNKAQQIAAQKNGFIVYVGLDGLLSEHLPTTINISETRKGSDKLDIIFRQHLSQYKNFGTISDSDDEIEEEIDNSVVELLERLTDLKISGQSKKILKDIEKAKKIISQAFINLQRNVDIIESSAEKLIKQAAKKGFSCYDVSGNGSCFYLAVLHQLVVVLKLTEFKNKTAQDLIALGIHEILENINFYQAFIITSVDAFFEKLLTPGEWADHIIMQAVANALKINIEIIRSDGAPSQPIQSRQPARAIIHLGYEVGLHYQSLVKQKESLLANNSVLVKTADNKKMVKLLIDVIESGDISTLQSILAQNKTLIDEVDTEHGCSLLMWAIINGRISMALLLISLNINLAILSKQVRNALHFAAKHSHTEIMQKLLEKYPDLLNQQDGDGMTSLHLSVRDNQIAAVKLLCATPGIQKNIKNNKNQTALELAKEKGFDAIATVITSTATRENQILLKKC